MGWSGGTELHAYEEDSSRDDEDWLFNPNDGD